MSEDVKEYSAEWWGNEIQTAEKELDKTWRHAAGKVVDRYLDLRDGSATLGSQEAAGARKYNTFWANTQILKSALYATPPRPVAKRLNDDPKDDAARVAALILQRILNFDLQRDNSDMHAAFSRATEDRLIPGLGQVWHRLRVETEPINFPPVLGPNGEEISPAVNGERIVEQEACTDYVHWRDFLWSPARVWEEVWWVARRVWMTKNKFIKRFGKEKYKEVKSNITVDSVRENGYPKGFEKNRVQVIEIWCKETMKVFWIQEHCKMFVDERPDPLQLQDFFPCPKMLLATHTTNTMIPRPDYVMVQDQYEELDILNDRISILTKALRIVGAYDSKNTALAQMITGPEFAMIPVDNWGMLAEKGGIKGVVDWFPVEVVALVLEKLVVQRQNVVQQIYELTSIADIMRGGSNPRETLGAQKLKAQYASVRLRLTQQDVGQFACASMKIKAEIICKHFTPEQIKEQSAIAFTESAQLADQAIELLKNFKARDYRIEISEESLSMADYTAEREMRLAYLTAVG